MTAINGISLGELLHITPANDLGKLYGGAVRVTCNAHEAEIELDPDGVRDAIVALQSSLDESVGS